MGSDCDEKTSCEGPSVESVVSHVESAWTYAGVYPRGRGDGFVQIVLPNRMDEITTFLTELSQCAGIGSQIVYVATSEETRLDVYLGSRFDSGSPIVRQSKTSIVGTLLAGIFLGLIGACMGAYMMMGEVKSGGDA